MKAPGELVSLLDLLEQLKRQHRAGIRPDFGQVEQLFDLGGTVRQQLVSSNGEVVPSVPMPSHSDGVAAQLALAARGKAAAMRAAGGVPAAAALEGLAADIETGVWTAWLKPQPCTEPTLLTR
jgi:hypothetical protein